MSGLDGERKRKYWRLAFFLFVGEASGREGCHCSVGNCGISLVLVTMSSRPVRWRCCWLLPDETCGFFFVFHWIKEVVNHP
ncbi:hypothetical protein ACQKWADRAFT_285871 [Trichoderma austrokoningii]